MRTKPCTAWLPPPPAQFSNSQVKKISYLPITNDPFIDRQPAFRLFQTLHTLGQPSVRQNKSMREQNCSAHVRPDHIRSLAGTHTHTFSVVHEQHTTYYRTWMCDNKLSRAQNKKGSNNHKQQQARAYLQR
jgi:hypothetical protein